MGISEKGRLLIVSNTFRKESDDAVKIRIISSRKATRHETASLRSRSGFDLATGLLSILAIGCWGKC
jgi:hypothetical protein